MKTGVSVPCSFRDQETGALITGCTAVTKTIVPDLSAVYYFRLSLVQNAHDIGFFDSYIEPKIQKDVEVSETTTSTTTTTTTSTTTTTTTTAAPVINPVSPTVTTNTTYTSDDISAVSGGVVVSDGGSPVTARGIVWGSSLPTLANYSTVDGTGTGVFTSYLNNLYPSTTYNIRAYATNAIGTAYGSIVTIVSAQLKLEYYILSGCDGDETKYVVSRSAQGGERLQNGMLVQSSKYYHITHVVNTLAEAQHGYGERVDIGSVNKVGSGYGPCPR